MEELLQRSPAAHNHIARVIPELQDTLGGILGRLTHAELTQTTDPYGILGSEAVRRIHPNVFDEEQSEQYAQVNDILIEPARLLGAAAEEVEKEPSLQGLQQTDAVFMRAQLSAIEEAQTLQSAGDPEGAQKELQALLVLHLLHAREAPIRKRQIRDVVASGMAPSLLGAIESLDGVIVTNQVRASRPTLIPDTLPRLLRDDRDLLRVATQKDFDDNFQNIRPIEESGPGRLDEVQEALDHTSLIALAKLEQKAFPEHAARLSVQALESVASSAEQDEDIGKTEDIIETIEVATSCTQNDEAAREAVVVALGQLRAHRIPGQPVRLTKYSVETLDNVLVELISRGNIEAAKQLMSSSPLEFEPEHGSTINDPENGNIGLAIKYHPYWNQSKRNAIRTTAHQLYKEKTVQLRQQLQSKGIGDDTISGLIVGADNPDSAYDIEPTLLAENSDSVHLFLKAPDIAATSYFVQQFLDGGGSVHTTPAPGKIQEAMKGAKSEETRERIAHELGEASRYLTEQGDAGLQVSGKLGSLIGYARPLQALKLAERLYEQPSRMVLYDMKKLFDATHEVDRRHDIEITPTVQRMLEYAAEYLPEKTIFGNLSATRQFLIGDGMDFGITRKAVELANWPGLSELCVLVGTDSVLKSIAIGGPKNPLDENRARQVAEAYTRTGLTDVLNDIQAATQQVSAAFYVLRKERDPVMSAERLVKLHNDLAFVREQGITVPYSSHIEDWINILESIPSGKAGAIRRQQMIKRLGLGIGEDQTEAMQIFEVLQADGDTTQELFRMNELLIAKLVGASSANGFPSPKPNKLKTIIFDQAQAARYAELHALKQNGDMEGVAHFMREYDIAPVYELEDLKELIPAIKALADDVHAEQRTAARWLYEYSGQPIHATKLMEAWKTRRLALRNGVADNPREILNFAAKNGIAIHAAEMIESRQTTITEQQLQTVLQKFTLDGKDLAHALGRRYAPATSFRAIEYIAEYWAQHGAYPDKLLRPAAGTFTVQGKEFRAEILDKHDPRGFTIGVDTGCCMTLDGLSESAIWAGYEDERYSFFALYDDRDRLRAQSLLYLAEIDEQRILVIDNIEANEGTDLSPVAEAYRTALLDFVSRQGLTIDAIHLGIAYTKADILAGLERAKLNPKTPRQDVYTYTDAQSQKVLWPVSE